MTTPMTPITDDTDFPAASVPTGPQLIKMKRNDKKVVFVFNTSDGKETREHETDLYPLVLPLSNGLRSIGDRVFSLIYGPIPTNSIVDTQCLDIKWKNGAIVSVKASGNITVAVGKGENKENLDGSWKSKTAIVAETENDETSGVDVIDRTTALVNELFGYAAN